MQTPLTVNQTLEQIKQAQQRSNVIDLSTLFKRTTPRTNPSQNRKIDEHQSKVITNQSRSQTMDNNPPNNG